MSLDKAIKNGKEKRNPYRNHDRGCGKYCSWCIEDRIHSTRKRMEHINAGLKEATTELTPRGNWGSIDD